MVILKELLEHSLKSDFDQELSYICEVVFNELLKVILYKLNSIKRTFSSLPFCFIIKAFRF